MMITGFNAVNLIASNNNNRNNNNNNNNNDNNDNNGQTQEAGTFGDIDNPGTPVVVPPLPGRRLFTRSATTKVCAQILNQICIYRSCKLKSRSVLRAAPTFLRHLYYIEI